jgi:gluconokinase
MTVKLPLVIVLMGVSGSGKTTIGRLLAQRLAWRYLDADDYHPPANVAKMAAGVPLDDGDRWPWLDRLNSLLREEDDAVLGCSALKHAYRKRLLSDVKDARIVFLRGSRELIASRIAARKHRYMPASLLDSQFAALEPPQAGEHGAIEIDVSGTPEQCVGAILRAINRP